MGKCHTFFLHAFCIVCQGPGHTKSNATKLKLFFSSLTIAWFVVISVTSISLYYSVTSNSARLVLLSKSFLLQLQPVWLGCMLFSVYTWDWLQRQGVAGAQGALISSVNVSVFQQGERMTLQSICMFVSYVVWFHCLYDKVRFPFCQSLLLPPSHYHIVHIQMLTMCTLGCNHKDVVHLKDIWWCDWCVHAQNCISWWFFHE